MGGEPAVAITPVVATPTDTPVYDGPLIENSLLEIGRLTRRSGRLLKAIKKVLENAKQSLYASVPAITHYAFVSAINGASTVHTLNSYKEAMLTP